MDLSFCSNSLHLEMPDVAGHTLRQMLTFVYTGEMEVRPEHVQSLFMAAHQFQIKHLCESLKASFGKIGLFQ